MKSFKQHLNELQLYHTGTKIGLKHAAPDDKEEKQNRPIWVAHRIDIPKEYYKDNNDNDYNIPDFKPPKGLHLSKVHVIGKLAHHKNPKIHKLLKKHGHSHKDILQYHDDIFTGPGTRNHKLVHDHPITKLLQKHGYVGYTAKHPVLDYHVSVIFHRRDAKFTHTLKGDSPNIHEKTRWNAGSDIANFDPEFNIKNSNKEELLNNPIWIGHHKDDTRRQYYHHERPNAHFSKVHIHGKVADYRDPKIHRLLYREEGHGQADIDQYHYILSRQPFAEKVHNHPITKTLKKHGFVGYTHPDLAGNFLKHKNAKPYERQPNTVVFHRRHVTLTPVQHGPNRTR